MIGLDKQVHIGLEAAEELRIRVLEEGLDIARLHLQRRGLAGKEVVDGGEVIGIVAAVAIDLGDAEQGLGVAGLVGEGFVVVFEGQGILELGDAVVAQGHEEAGRGDRFVVSLQDLEGFVGLLLAHQDVILGQRDHVVLAGHGFDLIQDAHHFIHLSALHIELDKGIIDIGLLGILPDQGLIDIDGHLGLLGHDIEPGEAVPVPVVGGVEAHRRSQVLHGSVQIAQQGLAHAKVIPDGVIVGCGNGQQLQVLGRFSIFPVIEEGDGIDQCAFHPGIVFRADLCGHTDSGAQQERTGDQEKGHNLFSHIACLLQK